MVKVTYDSPLNEFGTSLPFILILSSPLMRVRTDLAYTIGHEAELLLLSATQHPLLLTTSYYLYLSVLLFIIMQVAAAYERCLMFFIHSTTLGLCFS